MDELADQYFLSRRAYICALKTRMVVLDLTSGKYLSLDAACSHAVSKHIVGWPPIEARPEHIAGNEGGLELLLRRQLITRDPSLGKRADPVEVRTPTRWVGELRPGGPPHFNAGHVWQFFRAAAVAVASLRFQRMQQVVDRVSRRKRTQRPNAALHLDEIAELVRIFDWLRPLAFEKKNECFHYSLAMVEFLALHRVFPDWIFAVQDRPFRAHCWLQQEEHMLTDIPFGVRELTPIMVV